MIRVMFLEDYSGIETDNKPVKRGDILEVDKIWFERLIADKRAVILPDMPTRKSKIKVKVDPEPELDDDELYTEAVKNN